MEETQRESLGSLYGRLPRGYSIVIRRTTSTNVPEFCALIMQAGNILQSATALSPIEAQHKVLEFKLGKAYVPVKESIVELVDSCNE